MQVCKQCGQAVQDVETYCPRCGSSQLAPDNSQRRQKPAMNNHQKPTNIQPNGRVPQAAPPGYRNPNAPRVKQMQRPPMPHRQVQENVLKNQTQVQAQGQGNMTSKSLESQDIQNTFDFNNENQIESSTNNGDAVNKQKTRKGLFGKSNSKADKAKAAKHNKQEDNSQASNKVQNNVKLQAPSNLGKLNGNSVNEDTVTFKEWIVLMIKLIIPFYNIFVIYKILHDGNVKQSMREYIKAMLIFTICSVVIGAFGSLVFGTIISNLLWYI